MVTVEVIESMGAPGGVEPPTNGLGNRCSIQLSYGAASTPIISCQFERTVRGTPWFRIAGCDGLRLCVSVEPISRWYR